MRFLSACFFSFGVVLLCIVHGLSMSAEAAPLASFCSDIMFQAGKRPAGICGRAASAEGKARLDIYTRKAGSFVIVTDPAEKRMQVCSESLKAYVEIPLAGDAAHWRDLIKSATAVIFPQSLGMVNVQEVSHKKMGVVNLKGYAAEKSRSVFEVTFLGKIRRFEVELWENETFSPFPMQVAVAETAETHAGKAWLTKITADELPPSQFNTPKGYTRYTSVMDLVLYAIASL